MKEVKVGDEVDFAEIHITIVNGEFKREHTWHPGTVITIYTEDIAIRNDDGSERLFRRVDAGKYWRHRGA